MKLKRLYIFLLRALRDLRGKNCTFYESGKFAHVNEF